MSADLSEEVEPTALANLQCIDWVRALPGYEELSTYIEQTVDLIT